MDRRDFLMAAAAAGGTLALAPRALAAPPMLEATAVRNTRGLKLDWSAKTDPTSVYVSTDPDAQAPFMRALKTGLRGGTAEVSLAVEPRPYFLLTTRDGGQTRVAERLLPLKGGRNFRDLGGYRAADGRQVRWGKLFRSGVMNKLTPEDIAYLQAVGVRVVCDLRSPEERRSEPSPFLGMEAPFVAATDYDMSSAMGKLFHATNRAEAVDGFADSYVQFLDVLTPQFTDMFARLARRDVPLAMNCSAGKDRTGVGSALVLSVLGVPRETVIADYALTQVYTPPSLYLNAMRGGQAQPGVNAQQAQIFARMPREVLEVMMGSDPAVMRKALAEIDARYGGPVELAKARYGLTDAKIAWLRSLYLA